MTRLLIVITVMLCSACPGVVGEVGSGGPSQTGGSTVEAGGGGRSADAPDAAVVLVQPCDALPTTGWENISPPLPPAPPMGFALVGGVAVDPRYPGTVYADTTTYANFSPSAIWKTTDCGATWTSIARGKNADKILQGSPANLFVDPVTSDVYSESYYGSGDLFRSSDGGFDWDDITPRGPEFPGFIQEYSVDPTDHRHLIAEFHEDCPNAGPAPDGGIWHGCLAESDDGAATWKMRRSPLSGWAEAGSVALAGPARIVFGALFGGLWSSTDHGETWAPHIGYPGCAGESLVKIGTTSYLACMGSIQSTSDWNTFTSLQNAPAANHLFVTGKYLYAVRGPDPGFPISRAPKTDLTAWEEVPGTKFDKGSAWHLSYDQVHHVLYAQAGAAGLWRGITE